MKSVVNSIMKSWLGLALSTATVVGCAVLTDATAPPGAAIAGLVLLAGLARPGKVTWAMALAAPGAALVGLAGDLARPDWMAVAAIASIIVAAPLVADADVRWGRRLAGTPVAFAIASAGLFACVPDTEEARVLLAVALVAAVLSLLPSPIPHTLGVAGAMASTGVFVWIAAFDARGRPAAFVGAVTALGLLIWEPLGVWIRGARALRLHGRAAMLGGLGVHLVLVAYASRVVGLEHSVGSAVALAVPAALIGIAVGALLGLAPTTRPPTTRPPTTRPPTTRPPTTRSTTAESPA